MYKKYKVCNWQVWFMEACFTIYKNIPGSIEMSSGKCEVGEKQQ